MKKRFQLLVLSVLCAVFAHAQYVAPSEGVFRIINAQFGTAITEDFVANSMYCGTVGDAGDYDQMWILKKEGSKYTLQNVFSGRYVQTGASPFRTDENINGNFNIIKNSAWSKEQGETCYNIFDQSSDGLHCSNESNVVRWHSESSKAASEWRFVSVDITDEQIAAAREMYNSCMGAEENLDAYQAVLNEVFADAACTVLSGEYEAKSAEEIRAALAGKLPVELIDMAVKVKTGDWYEANENPSKKGWDSNYAKKFRVQMIEPHSVAGEITQWLGINAHSNMDNPIGVYANKYGMAYVIVEGEIKEGAELWFNTLTGHNISGDHARGIQLNEGLNIVPITTDGSAIYLDYIVHTYDPSTQTFLHKLSEYSDLKVNVVGGYINSYYNVYGDELYTADTDTDWMYYEERANLEIIDVVGRYQILHFELNDVSITAENEKTGQMETNTYDGLAKLFPERLPKQLPENQRINAIAEGWDRIMLSQMMAYGVASKEVVDSMNLIYPRWDATWTEKAEIFDYEGYADFCEGRDYSEYFNHHGIAYGTRSGFMSAGNGWCNYHINTTTDILVNLVTGGDAWGPAHEIGHQHQSIFTLNGEMEVTNNFFSNVSNWYIGLKTSRVAETQGNLENVYNNFKAGGNLYGNNIWALTQRYFRLWLYYHRVGHNTQFYPRLFELLRQNPMQRTNGTGGNTEIYNEKEQKWETVGYGNTDGKNSLLHFYKLCCEAAQEDLTEFFRAYGCFVPVDYANSMYNQTQKDIDRAIAEVKAKGYPENIMPLFINDCTSDVTYQHDGKTPRAFFDGWYTERGFNGELGCYVDFMARDTISGKYTYTLNDLTIDISGGQGAVGYAIFNSKGEIMAFSNNHMFDINDSTLAHMFAHNDAKLYAIAADENHVEIPLGAGREEVTGEYQYTLSENKLAVRGGQNAVGFGVYDAKNNLVVFTKKSSFEISDELARSIALGECVVRAHGINGSSVVAAMGGKALNGYISFELEGNTVNISSASNALCYIVYSEEGEELACSGVSTFDVTNDVLDLLTAEKAYIMALGINGTTAKVSLSLESFFRDAVDEVKTYLTLADPTETKVGMFYPDSVSSLAALVEQAEEADPSEYYQWMLTLDSAKNALLKNYKARIAVTPECYYAISLSSNENRLMGANSSGNLLTNTNKATDTSYAWRIVVAEEGVYYLKNRASGMYISSVQNGARVKAETTNKDEATRFKLVVGTKPGQYYIQTISGNLRLYNQSMATSYHVYAGSEKTGDAAMWGITLKDNLLGLPEVSTDEEAYIYYMQNATSYQYAYYQTTGFSTSWGVKLGGLKDEDNSYYFCFTPGSQEGTYVVHNHGVGYPLTVKTGSKKELTYDQTGEAALDCSIALNDEGTGLVISTEEGGKWYIASGKLAVVATDGKYTPWRLERMGTVSNLALDQTELTLSLEEATGAKLSATFTADLPITATWNTSDKKVVTVDADGQLTPKAKGSAIITASVGSLKATCAVTVVDSSTDIENVTSAPSIQTQNGVIAISGLANGTVVNVYSVVGNLVGTATANGGVATIDAKAAGSFVIVKVGEHAMKVSLR